MFSYLVLEDSYHPNAVLIINAPQCTSNVMEVRRYISAKKKQVGSHPWNRYQ
jgi:hypothetical protein